jgi:L-threonylcarbamoyladenylate synthase
MSFITEDVNIIVKRLEQGDIAAIPTETVYGLAADFSNTQAIKKVFSTKKRPANHPLILHILPEWDIRQWVEDIPDLAWPLMNQYWPGPLTLIFKVKPGKISPLVTGFQDTVAIRAPNHPLTKTILKLLGRPIVAPSANPFERLSPTTAEHVLKHFPDIDLAILQGGRCRMGMESTIIDMAYEYGKILRLGPLDIGEATFTQAKLNVPGAQLKHYQPNKPCYYFIDVNEIPKSQEQFYILSFTNLKSAEANYQFPNDIESIYHEFYFQLQKADESNAKIILIELPTDSKKFLVIRNRIIKAAQKLS